MSFKYFLGCISLDANGDDVKHYFSRYGKVIAASVPMDLMIGRNKGFGFVTMEDELQISQEDLNKLPLFGVPIYITAARPSEKRPERPIFIRNPQVDREKHRQTIMKMNKFISLRLFKLLKEKPDYLDELSPTKFEELVAQIVAAFGYEVELTPKGKDGGKDIIATHKHQPNERFYIECKKYAVKNRIDVTIVRQVHSVMTLDKVNKAIIATTSHFTRDAKELIKRIKTTNVAIDPKDRGGIINWIAIYLDQKNNNGRPFVAEPIIELF